jgi:hypothetical protein
MNIRKKIAVARFNRANANYQKHLFETKVAASQLQNWDIKTVKEKSDLIQNGNGLYAHKFAAIYEDDKPFDLGLASLKDAIVSPVLRARSARAYKQRNDIWQNVFAFLPKNQIPMLAGSEFVLGNGNTPEEEQANPSVGIATFGYPSAIDMPNIGDELMYANFETYDSVVETIKDRMGLRYVAVEPVGVIAAEGDEVNGTIGNLGFRVWYSKDDKHPLFAAPNPFSAVHQYRVEIIAKLRTVVGLEKTFLDEALLSRKPKKCSGRFPVITVASDTVTPQEYMRRVDDIRKVLGVPGLMIAPFGPLNEDRRLDSEFSSEPDRRGIYRTAFIFYAGDESEVVMEDVDLDDDGAPLAAASGFMPVNSVRYLLSKWEPKDASAPSAAV